MKKTLLTLAAFAVVGTLSAQTTYNFFDPADCDADGFLWFDTKEKLDKYVGYPSRMLVKLVDPNYELADFTTPECIKDEAYQGYGTDGVKGGAGSKKGAIKLPVAGEDFVGYAAPACHGGGILLHLPDCAKVDIYVSAEQENINLGLHTAEGNVANRDLGMYNLIKGGEFTPGFMGDDLPGVKYTGYFNDVEKLEDPEYGAPGNQRYFKIQSDKGVQRTIRLVNYMKTSPLYVHGIRVLQYTDNGNPFTPSSGVAGIEADENAAVEFFNMQGVKVSGEEPGLYIRRQGSKTTKVVVK